jgi:hypothetical protein
MARLDLSMEHGQPPDVAQERFEAGITEAMERYSSWIRRVDWTEDRDAATISGSGYEVRLWYDDRFLHAQGRIPLAWKVLEPAVKRHIRKMLARHV